MSEQDDLLKAGDFVRLKWGGPVMMARGFSNPDHGMPQDIVCGWFTPDGHYQQQAFRQDELVRADPPPAAAGGA